LTKRELNIRYRQNFHFFSNFYFNLIFIQHDLNRLKTGLQKLSEANELVSLMKEELILLGPKIEAKENVKI
jgi:hypothetical protein